MLDERFIDLLTKKLSDEISDGESAEFDSLLAGEDLYRKQYRTLKSYWATNNEQYSDSDLLFQRIKSRILPDEEEPGTLYSENRNRLLSPFFWRSIAAILLVG